MKEQRHGVGDPGTVSRWSGGYLAAALGVAAMTGLIALVPRATHIANISLLYLLVVIGMALRFGSGPAIFAAVLAFLAFDWFFVQPLDTFTVRDPAEWLALIMFLIIASITGRLTALLREQAEEARRRERETAALAESSWAVASQPDRERALGAVLRRIAEVAPVQAAAILTAGSSAAPEVVAEWRGQETARAELLREAARRAAQFVLTEGRSIGWEGDRHHWEKALEKEAQPDAAYLPLITEDRVVGLLYLQLADATAVSPPQRRVIESLANHAAVVMERDRLSRAEASASALAEADRLKTALLSMVSHDFRSPLASIKASVTGLLQEGQPWEPEAQRELLQGIDHESDRLNRMVGSILALSRLEADAWRPQCEWTAAADLIGAALDGFGAQENRRIRVSLAPSPAELWLDPAQMVQVLANLVDNALKYSPPSQEVELAAFEEGGATVLEVRDRGPGLARGEEQRVFEPFYRAPALQESAVPGMGIGLAICRGLVEAHGGRITARRRAGGGAAFRVWLPASAHPGGPTDVHRLPAAQDKGYENPGD